MHCREILFTPHCSPRSRKFQWLVNFFVRRTVAELRGVKVTKFSDFGLFSPYKTPIMYLLVTSLQPRGYILYHRMIKILPCGSRRSKEVPSGRDVFLPLLVGELGTPKLAKIFTYGKWLYPCRMLLHGASDLDQICLKTRNSEDECTFPPNIFAPIPKITQKTILGNLSMQSLLYTELSVSCTLMELRS